jgi:hypothetical protein
MKAHIEQIPATFAPETRFSVATKHANQSRPAIDLSDWLAPLNTLPLTVRKPKWRGIKFSALND